MTDEVNEKMYALPPHVPHAPPQRSFVSSLPQVVVDVIFGFVVHVDDEYTTLSLKRINPVSVNGGFPMRKQFVPLAMVSTAWLATVTRLHSESNLRNARVRWSSKRSDTIHQRQELTLRGAFVTRLAMQSMSCGSGSLRFAMETLTCLPHLQEMDLTELSSAQDVAAIIHVAQRACPAINKLVLSSWFRKSELINGELVATVFEAADRWRKSKGGGLRYLRLAVDEQLKDSESSNTYVNQIVKCCPRIERIDDGRFPKEDKPSAAVAMDSGEDAALWQVDLDTWTRFCETCSQLTSFNWLGMPFATQFFEIFGQHVKPNLKTLTLGTSNKWKWASYLSQANAATVDALTTKGEGFWKTLVRRCPLLQTLVIQQSTRDPEDCVALTNAALRGLSTLSALHSVTLDSVTIAGDGLFDLVMNHAADSSHERIFTIKYGHDSLYYTILKDFVTCLANHDGGELPCASRRVLLCLESAALDIDKEWSVEYFEILRELVQRARVKHPQIILRGIVSDYDFRTGSFDSIDQFTLATQQMPQELLETDQDTYERIDELLETDQDTYERIDEVFVSQQWPLLSFNGEEDDELVHSNRGGVYEDYDAYEERRDREQMWQLHCFPQHD